MSLSLAREKRDEANKTMAIVIDPSVKRRAEKAAVTDTFETIAREWLEMQSKPDEKMGRAALADVTRRRQSRSSWSGPDFLHAAQLKQSKQECALVIEVHKMGKVSPADLRLLVIERELASLRNSAT